MAHELPTYSRRVFLERGVTLASLCATVPAFLQDSALGMLMQSGGQSSVAGIPSERVLVLVQLGGGNDGLNTVVPYGDPAYHNARPGLGLGAPGQGDPARACIELDAAQGLGLHPSLAAFKDLLDAGEASIVQGVGYPNPNRSHFTSMDIWQTARTDGKGNGWVGRYFDCTCNGTPVPEGAISIGRTAPLAMLGDVQKPIAFESPNLFQWSGKALHEDLGPAYERLNRAGPLPGTDSETQASFLMRTALDAQVASDRIREAVSKRSLADYPRTALAQQLRTIAALIRDGLPTRVYYASVSGFDTHAGQAGPHSNLLRQFAEALRAFQGDLKAQGNDGRVLTLCFSEFGRRVRQNASGGTDHGTAAPVFLAGPMVRPGVLGTHPSLVDLDQGDLKFGVDFRSIYASVLADWLKAPTEKILDGRFERFSVVRS